MGIPMNYYGYFTTGQFPASVSEGVDMQQSELDPLVGANHPQYRERPAVRRSLRPSSIHQFDFEVGNLVRSPCIGCEDRHCFPKCIDQCDHLDQIHSVLANTISCTRRR